MTNIIEQVKAQLGYGVISQVASQLGEDHTNVSKAIDGLLPAVAGGVAQNADKPGFFETVKNFTTTGVLSNLTGSTQNNSVLSGLLSTIFGDKVPNIITGIATYAGVKESSASFLLNLVAGAVFGIIGKRAIDNNMSAGQFSGLMNNQKSILYTLLPAGLGLSSLGLASNFFGENEGSVNPDLNNTLHTHTTGANVHPSTEKVDVEKRVTPTPLPEKKEEGNSILKWLLPLLLLGVLAYFLMKNCKKEETTTTTTTTTVTDSALSVTETDTARLSSTAVSGNKELRDIDLNGTLLKGYANGLEERMIQYLKTGSYANASEDALKAVWYNFDNIQFVFGKNNELKPGSVSQLENVAKILKAYPDAKVKIGGYTDNVGDPAMNKQLSQERADFLKSELTRLGVGAQIISAEGYGSEFATVPASASNEERAKDRNMAIRFAK